MNKSITTILKYFRETTFPSHACQIVSQTKISNDFHRIKYDGQEVVKCLPKSETAVHRRLQSFTEKRLFMSFFLNKVAGLHPKKDTGRDVFLWVCLIFQKTFYGKHIWLVNASAKYHFFSCINLISKILISTLVVL